MNRAKRALTFLACLLVAATMSPLAANCIPGKTFANFNEVETGAYYYIIWGDPLTTSEDIVGRFWQTGNPGAGNEGTYDDSQWLLDSPYYPSQDLWYLNGFLGNAGVSGCPSGSLTVTATNSRTGTFFSAVIDETPPRSFEFDFSRLLTDFVAVPIPRPRIISSTRSGTDVNITVQVDDASAGTYGGAGAAITDVVIYQSNDPVALNIVDGNWVEIGRVGGPAGQANVTVDCSDSSVQASIGSGLEIDGQAPTDVGPDQSLVECDANLANPGGKFKLIERPNKPGQRPIKRR